MKEINILLTTLFFLLLESSRKNEQRIRKED